MLYFRHMAGSIEDLMGKKAKSTKPSDETAQEKFSAKMDEIKLKNLERLTQIKARELGFDHINLAGFPISPEALILVPREQAKQHKVVCFLFTGSEVRLGAVDPKDPEIEEIKYQVNERTHAEHAKVYMISEHSFELAEKVYDALPEVKEASSSTGRAKARKDDESSHRGRGGGTLERGCPSGVGRRGEGHDRTG